MNIRFFSLIAIFGALFGLLGGGLYRLQIEKSDYFFEKAEAREEARAALSLRRGNIFFTDRAGGKIPVALNKDFPVIYAAPKDIKNKEEAVRVLAPILQKSEEEIRALFSQNPKSRFKLLLEKPTREQISEVEEADLNGVGVVMRQYRVYQLGTRAAHLIGYVGVNDKNPEPVGLYGFEKLFEEELKEGDDLQFTIDVNIQAQAEQILQRLIETYGATGGTIIVEDPKTGKILTLANAPTFDPNEYQNYPLEHFLNPAVQYVYEPGSVLKPITIAAGIETGAITPETTFIDKGFVTLNGKTIQNALEKVYGKVTMAEVIEHSINTGAVFAESQIGHDRFLAFLKKFGFGAKTGVDIPSEVPGSLKNLERKGAKAIDFATASFGQGTATTPIQLISAFSVFANDGIMMKPYVNAEEKSQSVRRVISSDTAKKVITMMESAVQNGKVAVIPAYHIAGKTGTALIPDFKEGGYTDELIHTFIGLVPATDAKAVILVKLDKPQVGELAGITVVPAFRELAQFIINYYKIAPDKLPTP